MRTQWTRTLVLTLAVSGLTLWSGRAFGDDMVDRSDATLQTDRNSRNDSFSSTEDLRYTNRAAVADNVASDIRDRLGKTINSAVSKGQFDQLVGDLAKADRDRIGDYKNRDFPILDGRIDQFNKDWNAKYGSNFNLFNTRTIFSDLRIVQGADDDHALVIFPANYPGSSYYQKTGLVHDTYSDTHREIRRDVNVLPKPVNEPNPHGMSGSDRPSDKTIDLKSGSNVASGRVEMDVRDKDRLDTNLNLNEQPLVIRMVHESGLGNMWRIDAPDRLTGENLRQALLDHLTKLDEDRANWPSDVNQAYKAVAFQVLHAINNAPDLASPNVTIER